MSATSTTETEELVTLRLMVNKEINKVLFSEAGKDFVDALFSFLTFPLGTIARLLRKESNKGPITVGCLNSLYQSVKDLDKGYLGTESCKQMLLQPRNSSEEYCRSLKLNIDDTERKRYFLCSNFGNCRKNLLSTFKNQKCDCGRLLDLEVPLASHNINSGSVNVGVTNYIITNNLIVTPNSVDSSLDPLTMHEIFGIHDTSSVKALTLDVNKKKVIDLLKCCLLSESTLTDLFLVKKPLIQRQNDFCPCDVTDNSNSICIKVKLFIRKSDGKVLFAQRDEDFADFIMSFLTFPLGRVVRMLGGKCSLGSIDGLYKSIVDLDENKYIVFKQDKNTLVNPCIASHFKIGKQILPISEQCAPSYYCYYQRGSNGFGEGINGNPLYITDIKKCLLDYDFLSDYCASFMWVDPKSSKESDHGGYARRGQATFIVADDLVISPLSPISVVSLHDRLGIEIPPPSDVMQKVVTIGLDEGLGILNAALTSTEALTNGLRRLLTEVKQKI